MRISKKRKLLISQMEEYVALLDKSVVTLLYSYKKCSAIKKEPEYDLEQQESFEALNSRFVRTSDILTQKVFYVSVTDETAPFSHSLSFFAKQSDLYKCFSEAQKDFIDLLEPMNIEALVPEHLSLSF